MADTLLILGQSIPSGATLTTLYTVPGATSTTVSSIVVCNQGAANATFRVSVAIAGAADATSQYLYYDVPINANNTFVFTGGMTLAATDVVRVQSSNGAISFSLFGIQVT